MPLPFIPSGSSGVSSSSSVQVGGRAMPDLPAFKVVPPNQNLKVEDFRLPDGSPLTGPDGYLVPPAREFSMVLNAATRTYSYRFDEAMRDSWVKARAMRRDAFIRGLLEERILPTINRRWQLDVDDDRDPNQRAVRDALTKVVEAIPDFDAYKRALLDGVWFGRAGTQWNYWRNPDVNDLWSLRRWDPVHGDSIQFTFDGVPAILMDAMTAGWYSSNGATQGQWGDIRSTDRGGMALVLQRPTWRNRFAIHQHIREKADYFEGELAGSVQGLGLRGLVYWHYLIRTDALTWMLAYMQSVGQMDMMIFNFPWGNDQAKRQQEANANKIIGKAAFVVPRNPAGNWNAVEQLSMNDAGLKALHDLISEYFDRHIERLIVGQSMSAGADNDSGLGGSGRANFAKATKDEILVYDTNRLDEVLTRDLIKPLKQYNFKWARFPVRFKSVLPDLEAEKKVASGKTMVELKVPIKVDELREAAGYSRPEEGDDVVQPPPDPNAGPMGMGGPGAPPTPGGPPGTPQPGQPAPQQAQPTRVGPDGGFGPPVGQPSPQSPSGFGPSFNSRQPVAYGQRREGEVWQGPSGKWFKLKSGRVVPTKSPESGSSSTGDLVGPKPTAPREARSGDEASGGRETDDGDYRELSSSEILGSIAGPRLTDEEFPRVHNPSWTPGWQPPPPELVRKAELASDLGKYNRDGREVNAGLRSGKVDPYYARVVESLDACMRPVPSNCKFHRALVSKGVDGADGGKFIESLRNAPDGFEFTDPAFTSVSPSAKDNDRYFKKTSGPRASIEILAPEGTMATSYGERGNEVILARDTTFKKVRSEQRGDVLHVVLQVVKQPSSQSQPTQNSSGRQPVPYVTDASGHEHKGSGPGGGQFTRSGQGGGSSPLSQGPKTGRIKSTDGNKPVEEWSENDVERLTEPVVKDGLPNECYENARREYLTRKAAGESVKYVVGNLYGKPAGDKWFDESKRASPTPHAWVETEDGDIIDPTPFKYGIGDYKNLPQRPAQQAFEKALYVGEFSPADSTLTEPLKNFPAKISTQNSAQQYDAAPAPAATAPYFPGGSNTYLPEFDKTEIGFTRLSRGQDPTRYGEKLGCVMVPLQGQAAIELLSRAALVRDCDLADDGREEKPHVTVRYGFHGGVTMGDVQQALRGKGPFELTLGGVSCFYGEDSGKDYDVVKVDVTSPQIRAMNSILGGLPNTATHSEYEPHATLAYVRAGEGRKYTKLLAPLDLRVVVDELEYSDSEKAKSYLRLTGPGTVPQTQYAAAHAPKGGVSVAGKQFTGGQFIPSDVMDRATPEERARVEGEPASEKTSVKIPDRVHKTVAPVVERTLNDLCRRFNIDPASIKVVWQSGGTNTASTTTGIKRQVSAEEAKDLKAKGEKVFQITLGKDPKFVVIDKGDTIALRTDGKGVHFGLPKEKFETLKDRTGWHSKTGIDPIESTIIHEFGHVLQHRAGLTNKELAGPVPEEYADLADKLGRYAKTSYGEFLSEAFLAYVDGQKEFGPALEPLMVGSRPATQSEPSEEPSLAPPNPISPVTASVLSRLPRTAYERLSGRVTKLTEAPTAEAVTEAWYAGEASPPPRDRWTTCYGFYDPATGELVTGPGGPSVDQRGVLAHEVGHALDQSDDRKHFQLSGDPEFVQAWRAEMGRGQLSNYARTDEVEGFAEACRLAYGTEGGMETFRSQFPRCYAYFKRIGLAE